MTRKLSILATVLAAALQAAPAHAVVPQVMTYSGYLKTSGGVAVTAPTNLSFRLYTAASGGTPVWSETLSATPSSDGWFSVVLGTTAALPFASLGGDLYLGIEVATEGEFPQRARLTPSYAAISVDWSGVANRPAACAAGQFLTGYDAAGAALCATPAGGGTGGVASVAGSGPISATGTTAVTVSLTGCSAANQILQWNGASWGCINTPAPGSGGVTQVQAALPLTVTGTTANPIVGLPATCGPGQVLKWSGTIWACANDLDTVNAGTVTSVAPAATVGNPITVANGTGAATIDLAAAGSGTSGYLKATDWVAFNAKLTPPTCNLGQVMKWDGLAWSCATDVTNAGTVTGVVGTAPISATAGAVPTISMPAASAGVDGYLRGTDFSAFSAKITAPGGCTDGQVVKWNAVASSFVCAADSSNAGTVTGVSAVGPLSSTGGATPAISMSQATNVASGWLSSADWNTFNNKIGTVLVTSPLGASSGGGTATIGLSGCAQAGQELMWNGTNWVCSDFGLPLQVLGRTSTAPVLFMSQASAATDGYLSGADFGRFDAKVSGIAPGAGISVDAVTDPRNPVVGVSFPAAGARAGTAAQAARADHDHGRAKLVASFANTSDSITGGSVNKGDGALVITTIPGAASVIEIKNVNSAFTLGTPSAGSSLAFKANASLLTGLTQTAYVFFGGVVGVGNQTGGYGFRFQGDGAGGRTVTAMTMRGGGLNNTLSLPSPLPSGMFSFYAVHRGATVDFYIDGGLFTSLSAAGMLTDTFQAYTVRMEQPASANTGTFALTFLTLETQAL